MLLHFCTADQLYNRQATIEQERQMLYQKSLKQLNAVFPKFNIKPPVKKAILRSLVLQIEVPYFSSADLQLLKDPQTAPKSLQKLSKLIKAWIKMVENNEKARQQQIRQVDMGISHNLEQLQFILAEAEQVNTEQQFVLFMKEKGEQLYGGKANTKSIKDYKQTQIPKEREFYNTITRIGEEQYFNLLELVLQKLGVLQQEVETQISKMDSLKQLHAMVEADEIFKKKDNILNQVINYNLMRAARFATQIQADRKALYYYEDELTFAIARCYYLLYLAERDLVENNNEALLDEIESFLCIKKQWVFPKLYGNKIIQPLLRLEQKRRSFLTQKYEQPISPTQLAFLSSKIVSLQNSLLKNNNKRLSEQQFLQIYPQIQNLLIQTSMQTKMERKNLKHKENRNTLAQLETQVLKLFANQADQRDNKTNSRKVLSVANSRLSGKSHSGSKSRPGLPSNHNHMRNTHTVQSGKKENSQTLDLGEDVFLQFTPQSTPAERRQKIQSLSRNGEEYEKQCKNYLLKIKPIYGQILDDADNFHPEQLNILIEAGSLSPSTNKQTQILGLINRNLIKPEVSEQKFYRIFQPVLRFNVLKSLSQKLIELAYKNSKIFDHPDFETLPENLKQFIQTRSSFLKVINKQFEKIIGIGNIIGKLQFQPKYDVCRYETYQIFLKILLAEKQARSYELSFKDQKKPSRQTSFFVRNKIYGPFITSLGQLLPPPYNQPNQIVQVLDELEFFREFKWRTEQIVAEALENLASKAGQEMELQKRDLARIFGNWVRDASERLKVKKDVFVYESAQAQLKKLNELIRICNNDRSVEVKDPAALEMLKLIKSKQ